MTTSTRSWFDDFAKLQRGLSQYLPMADGLESPDPEDDLFVKMAIVGYSFHQPTEEWGIDNLHFIQRHRQDEYSDAELADHGDAASSVALFACLAYGYMLGLFQAGSIDEIEFSRGEALLPGFLALHSTELPITKVGTSDDGRAPNPARHSTR